MIYPPPANRPTSPALPDDEAPISRAAALALIKEVIDAREDAFDSKMDKVIARLELQSSAFEERACAALGEMSRLIELASEVMRASRDRTLELVQDVPAIKTKLSNLEARIVALETKETAA